MVKTDTAKVGEQLLLDKAYTATDTHDRKALGTTAGVAAMAGDEQTERSVHLIYFCSGGQ